MRFQNPGSLGLSVWVFAITVLAVSFFGAGIKAQTELPERVMVRGTVIDLSCASTGKALTGSWENTEIGSHDGRRHNPEELPRDVSQRRPTGSSLFSWRDYRCPGLQSARGRGHPAGQINTGIPIT